MKCLPAESGELHHVLEFVVYNTPGPHGFTPRDIDRRWSASTPLERELQPFTQNEFEPVTEYVSNLFKNYREILAKCLNFFYDKAVARRNIVNKHRHSKEIHPGMEVVLRDPRKAKAGGRTPYRQPYSEPAVVTETHGNKMIVKKADGTLVKNIHMEDALVVPEGCRNLEWKDIVFEED